MEKNTKEKEDARRRRLLDEILANGRANTKYDASDTNQSPSAEVSLSELPFAMEVNGDYYIPKGNGGALNRMSKRTVGDQGR